MACGIQSWNTLLCESAVLVKGKSFVTFTYGNFQTNLVKKNWIHILLPSSIVKGLYPQPRTYLVLYTNKYGKLESPNLHIYLYIHLFLKKYFNEPIYSAYLSKDTKIISYLKWIVPFITLFIYISTLFWRLL